METIKKREAWNKGKLLGQKPPLKPKDNRNTAAMALTNAQNNECTTYFSINAISAVFKPNNSYTKAECGSLISRCATGRFSAFADIRLA